MKLIKPHDYQLSQINTLRQSMVNHKRILFQAVTGWGKTIGAAYMMTEANKRGNTCFFVVPRIQLLDQTAKSLSSYRIDFSYIASGMRCDPTAKIMLCTSPTLALRLDRLPYIPKIVFIDEAHYGGSDVDAIVDFFTKAGSWVIGLSATPLKQNGRHMSDWFDHMVLGPQISWMMEQGHLSKYRLLAPSKPDLSQLRVSNGDYRDSDLTSYMEGNNAIIGDMVSHYSSVAMGKLNIAFGVSIKHTEQIAEAFRDGGIPCAAVHSKLPKDEIKRRIVAFAKRELLCLAGKDLMTFGFDLSAAADMDVTVESMSDGAPTLSLPKQLQKWGRVLRKKPFPAIIFDHGGNAIQNDGTMRHGYPDDDRHWNLEREEKKGKGGGGEKAIPVRQCPVCYMCHRPADRCIACGHVYEVKGRNISEEEGDLIEVTREELAQVVKQERRLQGQARTLHELIELGKRKGMKNPHAWAKHVLSGRKR